MYIFFLLLLPLLSYSAPDISHEKLANSPKWLRLLHYKRNLLGGYTSQADGAEFFLHPEGKTNPVQELRRSIKLFSDYSEVKDGHPICKFPLRYKWLNFELGMKWKADLTQCKNYVNFFSKLAAKRASIIFSSYYLSNPNSAFGHTFLRLSRFDDADETEMLDYGINYSAEATAKNPFSYAVNGLLGGYKGKFAAIPYYYKVREYSNSEFRDLWSYNLKLNFYQVLEMVDHIWELGHTYFDYFYFKENCSYHLLSVIEVVMPEKKLTDTYSFFAIPADTIRLLKKEGLIDEGKRRESTYSKLTRLSADLSGSQLEKARAISQTPVETKKYLNGTSDKEAAEILDVSLEAFDYYNAAKILGEDLKTKELKNNILLARAKNPVISGDEKVLTKAEDSPARSHSPTRAELSQGYESKNGQLTRLELRASHHDLLDPPQGSLKDAQLEIGKISLVHKEYAYSQQSLQVEKLTLVNIKNFPAQNFWASPRAWEIEVGMKQIDQNFCFDCPGGFISGSIGNGLQLGSQKKILMAFLLAGDLTIHNNFEDHYRLGLGPKLYLRYMFHEKLLSGFEASYFSNTTSGHYIFSGHDSRLIWETRYHAFDMTSLVMRFSSHETRSVWSNNAQLGVQFFY